MTPLRSASARLLAVSLALVLVAGCTSRDASHPASERGHDPWVFRSVLDWQPRMVTLALADSFWVAYHADNGALYKVWQEGVNFDGPVYTTAHGPQPTTIGRAYLVSPYRQPWQLLRGDQATPAEAHYRGHRFVDGQAVLTYTLGLPDGAPVTVTETPEFVRDAEGRPGLERRFTTAGVPAGTEVALDVHLNSLLDADSYTTDGRFEAGPASEVNRGDARVVTRNGRLVLHANGTTRFTAWFNPVPMVLPEAEEVTDKPPGLALIEQSDCHACHNTEAQTVGPSYRAIAERYETSDATLALLASKIVRGGSGNWTAEIGEAIMTPHPDLQPADARRMVAYILALDDPDAATADAGASEATTSPFEGLGDSFPLFEAPADTASRQGIAVNVYRFGTPVTDFPSLTENDLPVYAGVVPALHLTHPDDFGELAEHFYLEATGTLDIPETTNYVFRLANDDGAILTIDDKVVIEHGGLHGPDPKDGEVYLQAGPHPFSVRYFQASGGLALSLQWVAHGADGFSVVPPEAFTYNPAALRATRPFEAPELRLLGAAGDGQALRSVHPSFDLQTIRPAAFEPMVGGLDFLSDGRLAVSTWDPAGSVYLVGNLDAADPEDIQVKRIATGLAEPLGLAVVEDTLYVLQKQELTQLIDHDGDEIIDEYRTVANGWGATSNFHEFAFGLVYRDGFFYGTLATAIQPGGASTQPQNPDRGKVLQISRADGSVTFLASGLRTPNGIGIGVDGELFVADNQGDWLPSSKIVHIRPGAWFGSRSVDPEGTAGMQEAPPVVWLPQDEIGNSPTTPAVLDVGPYAGQMIHGEVTHGGIKRVFAEQVNGQYQGAVFRFTQGLEAGVNRLRWGPDGKLYIGGIGNPGNWSDYGKRWYGLQRLGYNGASTFEMLAVRAKTNGLEITFTEPLQVNDGFSPADYRVQQWWYKPTPNYGGPKVDLATLPIRSVHVSEDHRRVFLEIDGMKPGHVVYLRLMTPFISQQGHELWSTEAWYTLNQIPADAPGFTSTLTAEVAAPNQLTRAEQQAGWQLLFDGQTTNGWHTYGQDTIGSAWRVEDGTLTLGGQRGEGAWQIEDGGDIVTAEPFEDFELRLDWKISPGGNSGLIYNVQESPDYEYVWQTGPEMQILDDDRHPDGRIPKHRAGDLYDLISSAFVATRPVGQWNEVRLIQQGGRVQHWLNGHKIVEYEQGTPAWEALVAGSKFAEMPGFGQARQGRLALQDHGDRVWYRNIKIRPL